jgi:hypothetical protein
VSEPVITVTISLPADARAIARLLTAIDRAFPGATIRNGDDCWVVEIPNQRKEH